MPAEPRGDAATRRGWPATRGGRYEVDPGAIERAIHPRTRMLLLCNPHNPVGRVFTRAELERIAEACLRHDLTICADEIHCELIFPGHQHVPIASLSPEVEARTITLMAPSKTFNLPALKASVAIIPNAALRERFVAAQADLVRAVNVFGYVSMLAAYRDGQPWLDDLLRYLEGNRDFLARYVSERLPGVRMVAPRGHLPRLARLHRGRHPRRRSLHVLPRARARGSERRRRLRRAGLRPPQLRVPARHPHRGPRPHARRVGRPAPGELTGPSGRASRPVSRTLDGDIDPGFRRFGVVTVRFDASLIQRPALAVERGAGRRA